MLGAIYCYGPKTANINIKKWQSPLKKVVIDHHRTKTANIKGRRDREGRKRVI